ncbi:HAD superfamily hydrolase [Secundilactobacillus oryzae JCM 18671]|uniref:HAD superfamily hydrolase n=1 Tax=Secundilactobacillus oryzae JCM 18671 TaxID=1291743 RepID=A0A081BJB0_9LACO|nr:Cof-type HAD-IIB family hydrolase [Secundilactobacillus oryzae]GAK48128.1 HAD superfamily hydrolase [Secundilactobacillus oryzae JCM 18671]
MIKMIATDMDGTFLSDEKKFNRPRFQTMLTEMERQGVHFVAASGNQLWHLQEVFSGLEGEITYVAENGAVIVANGQTLHADEIPSVLWHEVIKLVREQPMFDGVHVIISGQNGAYTEMSADSSRFAASNYFYSHFQLVPDLLDVQDTIFKMDLSWEHVNIYEKADYFNNHFDGQLRATSSGLGGMDVIMPHVHKAYGLEFLQKQWQITPEETLAFGDNGNDIEMLQFAKYGYAMKNAAPEVLKAAPFVTEWNNNEEGVLNTMAAFLKR